MRVHLSSVSIDPNEIGRTMDQSECMADFLNGAGACMSKDPEDVEAWMNEVIYGLSDDGKHFVDALAESMKALTS
jgi:hypothetical protein